MVSELCLVFFIATKIVIIDNKYHVTIVFIIYVVIYLSLNTLPIQWSSRCPLFVGNTASPCLYSWPCWDTSSDAPILWSTIDISSMPLSIPFPPRAFSAIMSVW